MLVMIIKNEKGDRIDYTRKKVSAFLDLPEFDHRIVDISLRKDVSNDEHPILLNKSEWPRLESDELDFAESCIERFIKEVNERSPLIDEEVLISDTATILKERYQNIASGTPVLRRDTNLATLYYLRTDIFVDDSGTIKFKETPLPVLPAYIFEKHPEESASDIAPAVIGLLANLLKSLAGAVGSKIGAEAMKEIFPDKIDFTELKNYFDNSVKGANTEQTVAEQEGIINGIHHDITNYYYDRKVAGEPKENLYRFLVDRHTALSSSIGILQTKSFQRKGLATFVAAASLDFALYQEMALQDPIAKNPLQSSNLGTLTKSVREYTKYVNDLGNGIFADNVKNRIDKITDVSHFSLGGNGGYAGIYYFEDHGVDPYYRYEINDSSCHDNPYLTCKTQHDIYVDKIRDSERSIQAGFLKWIFDCSDIWQSLIDKPLPSVVPRADHLWDELTFMQSLESKCEDENVFIANKIIEWARTNLPEFAWRSNGDFLPRVYINNIPYVMFSLSTEGHIYIEDRYLYSIPPFSIYSDQLRCQINLMTSKLNGSKSFKRTDRLDLSVFNSRYSLENTFLGTFEEIIKKIKYYYMCEAL